MLSHRVCTHDDYLDKVHTISWHLCYLLEQYSNDRYHVSVIESQHMYLKTAIQGKYDINMWAKISLVLSLFKHVINKASIITK